jgi:hydroxyacylglutathione hydrolase
MLLKYFYDRTLAHASYLVGCQKTGEAVVVDPGRDIEPYLEAAKQEGVRVTAVAETHIHADYVSGARELAERVGAKLLVSDAGPKEWKYQFLDHYPHQKLQDGDFFRIGNIHFDVLHTPGHTPESISFLVTDRGGNADQPMGIFTGDFVFVGSIGRPDLLEEAAGMRGTAEPGARDLFRSAERFKQLPDHLQVWPAHGAGSACGKGLGAIPSSTVGYEKRFNPALQFDDEDAFVKYILADQPEAPKYFAVMKRVNKLGPEVIGNGGLPSRMQLSELPGAIQTATVIDLSPSKEFARAHLPWAGWLVDYERPAVLIATPDELPEAIRVLRKIGMDHVVGYVDADEVRHSSLRNQSYPEATPEELAPLLVSGAVQWLDVRSDEEWKESRIPGAEHRFLGRLPEQLESLDPNRPVVVQCRTGGRSAIAASLLQAAGYQVTNLSGGFLAWVSTKLPIDRAGIDITV